MGGGKDRAVMQKGNRLSAPFFSSPRHWTIDFNVPGMKEENQFLFRIGKSVITAMDVNHDPNSTVSLHSDGSPVQTAFSLTFQEIELPISCDKSTDRTQEQKDAILQAQRDKPVTGTVYPGSPANQGGGAVSPINPEGKTLGLPIPSVGNRDAQGNPIRSDFRLKDNITLLQGEGFGIPNIYSFNYKWDTETTWI